MKKKQGNFFTFSKCARNEKKKGQIDHYMKFVDNYCKSCQKNLLYIFKCLKRIVQNAKQKMSDYNTCIVLHFTTKNNQNSLITMCQAFSSNKEGPGGSMSQVVGLPNNSYKPITNTAWGRKRGCTRLAAASDKSLPVACPWSVVLSGYSGLFHH